MTEQKKNNISRPQQAALNEHSFLPGGKADTRLDAGLPEPFGNHQGKGFHDAQTRFLPDYAEQTAALQDRRKAPPRIYAALDLGTNNCRLIVVRATPRGFTIIDTFSRIIRLGEGLSKTGALSKAAMDRAVEALKVCAEKLQRAGVIRAKLIATEACRAASNGDEFIERVRAETGLHLEIISREIEARLAVAGCASLLDRNSDWALVFDIGGGSSELVWLDLRRFRTKAIHNPAERIRLLNCIVEWVSIPIGVVTLAERHGGRDVDPPRFDAMVDELAVHLRDFEHRTGILNRINGHSVHMLGTSGTVTTLAGVHLNLPYYNRAKVDGCWMSIADVRAISARLLAMSYEQRIAEPCIGAERADLVLGGCAILEAVLRAWPCERLRVADRGLREGILTTLMAEDSPQGHHASRKGGRRYKRARH